MSDLEPYEQLFVLEKLRTRYPFEEKDFSEEGFVSRTMQSDGEKIRIEVLKKDIEDIANSELYNIVSDAMSFVCSTRKDLFLKAPKSKRAYIFSAIIDEKYSYVKRFPKANVGYNIINESLFWKSRKVLLFVICGLIFDWYIHNLNSWAGGKAHEIYHRL